MIPFGNMDQWIDRQIKESGIIGGATKNVYAVSYTHLDVYKRQEVYQAGKEEPLQYNKEDLLNPWFIVEPRRN